MKQKCFDIFEQKNFYTTIPHKNFKNILYIYPYKHKQTYFTLSILHSLCKEGPRVAVL